MIFDAATLEQVREVRDWHFNPSNLDDSAIFPGPRRLSTCVPLREFAKALFEDLRTLAPENKTTYVVSFEGIRFRAQELSTGVFAVRTLRDKPMKMDELGFSPEYVQLLMSPEFKTSGGLILVCGPTGSGKTTTASSVFSSRLTEYGGYGMTQEDPPEFQLGGWHGDKGYCDQVQIPNGNFHQAMINALRGFPSEDRSMLLFGEILEPIAASELLRIGVDGHLVLTTIHSDGVITGINRLLSLAKEKVGEVEARQLLAASLKLVVHQRRDNVVPQLTTLQCGRTVDNPIRSAISNGTNLSSLQQNIQQQKIQLEGG